MAWEVEYTDEFETWWVDLDQDDQDKLAAAVNLLVSDGPNLKRPVVGKTEGATRHTHMKELIPGSSSIRVLFAFDPVSHAILLLGGDKRGDWTGWYAKNVQIAEDLYDEHIAQLHREGLIYMAKPFKNLSDPIMADRRRAARVAEHEAAMRDSIGLREIRTRRGATQTQVADGIGVTQARISILERQDDLYLSTLEGYIHALGGTLEVRAVFPDETIELTHTQHAA